MSWLRPALAGQIQRNSCLAAPVWSAVMARRDLTQVIHVNRLCTPEALTSAVASELLLALLSFKIYILEKKCDL